MESFKIVAILLCLSTLGITSPLEPDPDCSLTTKEPTGTFKSPKYPFPEPVNKVCTLLVTAPPGEVVTLTIDHFDLNPPGSSLTIHDGSDDSAPSIGAFTGDISKIYNVISSTGNSIYVYYQSASAVSVHRGFNLTWAMTANQTESDEPSGVITSPYYNDGYALYVHYTWLVNAPDEFQRICLTVKDFDLDTNDYLEILDGSTGDQIGKFTGNIYHVICSIGRSIRLHSVFQDMENAANKGFNMTWEATASTGGVIESPYYNKNYTIYDNYTWVVNAPDGSLVSLYVDDIDFDQSDYLEIWDGENDDSDQIANFTGESKIYNVICSSGRSIRLHSVQQSMTTPGHRGFHISWHTIANQTESDKPTGEITSPYYNDGYALYAKYTWLVNAPNEFQRICLTVKDFDLDTQDYLEILDESMGDQIGNITGNDIYKVICSSGRSIRLHSVFQDKHNAVNRGFHISWEVTANQTESDDPSGVITSPYYNHSYALNVSYTWIVNAPDEFQRICLTVIDFDLDTMDYLEIKDVSMDDQIGKFSGDDIYNVICSIGRSIRLHSVFQDKHNAANKGFHISWEATANQTESDKPTGEITSPYYNDGYALNVSYTWIVNAPDEFQRICLTVMDFDLDTNDYLEILDVSTDDPIGTFSGNDIYNVTCSSGRSIRLHSVFQDKQNAANRGFIISWEATANQTEYNNQSTGEITSPYYNEKYALYANYTWLVNAPDGFLQICLTVMDFDLDTMDYLEIVDELMDDQIGKFTGNDIYNVICSSGRIIRLQSVFKDKKNAANKGFHISWKATATGGQSISNDTGIIRAGSYNHTNISVIEKNFWVIHAPVGKQITLQVLDFNLDPNTASNYVTMRDGQYDNSPVIGFGNLTSKTKINQVISSTGNHIRVEGKIASKGGYRGYSFSYGDTVCGGDFYLDSGVIISPNYPWDFPQDDRCVWRIHMTYPHVVHLTVNEFELQNSGNCFQQYLEVRNGMFRTSDLLGRFCGNVIPFQIASTGSDMWVEFVSGNSPSPDYRGFNITWGPAHTGYSHGSKSAPSSYLMIILSLAFAAKKLL